VTRSTLIRALFVTCIAAYPFLIYFGLQYLPPTFFAVTLMLLIAMRFGVLVPEERPIVIPMLLIFVCYATVAAVTGSQMMLLYYPAIVNFTLCGVFLNSLRQGDPLLLRIVRARGVPMNEFVPRYMFNLTLIWAVFFVVNGALSIWSSFVSIEVWTAYNGFLSYCLVALLIGIEYVFRYWYKRSKGVQ